MADQSPNATPYIPHHIIFQEILPKLPAKSLIRFKSVDHEWNSVISSVKFAKTHILYHSNLSSTTTRTVLTLDDENDDLPFEAAEVVENRLLDSKRYGINAKGPYTMLSSCNGLVLLISTDECYNGYYRNLVEFGYVVCNPVLGADHFVEIPHPNQFHPVVCNICDYNFGFGYVSSRDDYYIVAICLAHDNQIVVLVYSLRSQRWIIQRGQLTAKVKGLTSLRFRNQWYDDTGTLVAETLHWGVSTEKACNLIMAYDLANQDKPLRMMPLPRNNFGVYFSLCCLKGCLCAWASNKYGTVAEMWMLKQYGVKKSWTKLFCFKLHRYFCNRFFGFTMPEMVLVLANRHLLIFVDLSYDPPVVSNSVLYDICDAVSYIPSLVSVFALISDSRE